MIVKKHSHPKWSNYWGSRQVHDAILIEAPLDELDETVEQTQEAMARASEIVLDGSRLRSDALLIRYPNRYEDERGQHMWDTVWKILSVE